MGCQGGKIAPLHVFMLAAYGRRMQAQQHTEALFDNDTIDGLRELGDILLNIRRRLASDGIMIESQNDAKRYAQK